MSLEIKVEQQYEIAHRATEGHFAGHPIIPGVVILADVMRVIRQHFANQATTPSSADASTYFSTYSLRAAKFLRPVLPGHSMTIALKFAAKDVEKNRQAVSFECLVAASVVAKGAFDFYD